ncbi:MAG: polysaccharide biosynthesis C-terminal domain-containing protein [Erysipelotrichaceae bacterium]|nr:polysaccharide biosynthesis C-terminal domain-containing protein [Erysipelotrichaceae bacterium]
MDRKLFKNYLYNILFQLVRLLLPFVTVPYTLAHLTSPVLGISDFAGNIASWFILFGILGVNVYGNRQTAKVRDDRRELSRTFWEIFTMQLLNMAVVSVLYALYITFTVKESRIIYYLYLFTIAASAFDITWLFYGVEDFGSVTIRNTAVKLLGVACIFLFVKTPQDLGKFVLINSFAEILGQAIMFMQLGKYVDRSRISLSDAYKHHFRGTVALFIPTIAINVYTLLDQSMLGYIGGDLADLNQYKTAQSFIKIFLYFVTAIGSVMLPRVTNIFYNHEEGKSEALHIIDQTFRIAMALAVPMTAAMITVSPYFFPWYLKESSEIVPRIVQLVRFSSPLILFISVSNVFGIQYLVPTGRTKAYSTSVIAGACVNFVCNALLIPRLGGLGAAFGSLAAELTVTMTQYVFVRQDIKPDLKAIGKYTLAALAMSVCVAAIGRMLGARMITNILQAVLGAAVYALMLILLKEEMITSLLRKVRERHG